MLLLGFYLLVVFIWCIAYALNSHGRVFERRHLMLGNFRVIGLQQLQGHVCHLHKVVSICGVVYLILVGSLLHRWLLLKLHNQFTLRSVAQIHSTILTCSTRFQPSTAILLSLYDVSCG